MSNSPPKDKSAQSHVAFAVQILSIISIPVFLVFLYLYYFDNNPPCTYSSFELNQTEYCRGDFVDVSIAYCKKKSVPFTMYMRLANDVSINIEPITVIEGAPLGCGVYDFKTVRIPDCAPYGTY